MVIWQNIPARLFLLSIAICFLVTANSYGLEDHTTAHKCLEGYEVKFDFKKHQAQREIVYEYLIKKINFNEEYPSIPNKKDIGIYLYDLDDNRQDEVFYFIGSRGYCGSLGCQSGILKQISNQIGTEGVNCKALLTITIGLAVEGKEQLIILSSKTLGHYDLSFEDRYGDHIFRWQGEYYDDKDYNAKISKLIIN